MVTKPRRQVDFAKLKERVDVLQIVDHYGWRKDLKRAGKSYTGRCPICGSGKRSFTVTPPRAWKCFGDCDTGGNQLDLVAHVEGVSLQEAAVKIAGWFGIDDCDRDKEPANGNSRGAERGRARQSGASSTREPVRKRESDRKGDGADRESRAGENKPLGWKKPLQGLDPEHEWLVERGFRSDTLEEFGIGHSDRGMMAGHIAIPIFSAEGEILAYAGRDTGAREVVYKYPEKFRRELELYNLHRALASERYEDDGLVIAIDFFDVVALFEAGIENVVALMDPEVSEQQLAKLRDLDNPSGRFTVVVAHLDQAAGEALVGELVNIGYAHLKVAPMHEAISEMSAPQVERLLL